MTSPKLVLWVTFIQWCSKWFTNIDFLWDARIIYTVYWLLVFIGTRLTVISSEYASTTLIKQKSMGIRESLAIPYIHSYSLPKYIFKFVVLTVDRGKKFSSSSLPALLQITIFLDQLLGVARSQAIEPLAWVSRSWTRQFSSPAVLLMPD